MPMHTKLMDAIPLSGNQRKDFERIAKNALAGILFQYRVTQQVVEATNGPMTLERRVVHLAATIDGLLAAAAVIAESFFVDQRLLDEIAAMKIDSEEASKLADEKIEAASKPTDGVGAELHAKLQDVLVPVYRERLPLRLRRAAEIDNLRAIHKQDAAKASGDPAREHEQAT